MKKLSLILSLACFLAAVSHAGTPGNPALSFTGGGNLSALSGTYGWTFTLTGNSVVIDLGYFDFGGNGLNAAHTVDLWANDGTLLLSATVPSGTNGFLQDGFRYTNVVPTILTPGTYTIGGFEDGTSSDPISVDTSSVTTVAGVTFDGARSASGASLIFPTGNTFGHGNSYFGPNFVFAPTNVPEPATNALLLLGAAAVGGVVHWRRRSTL